MSRSTGGFIPKHLRPLARKAERQGWRIEPIKHGTVWLSPDGKHRILMPGTVNDKGRRFKNLRAELRKAGLTN